MAEAGGADTEVFDAPIASRVTSMGLRWTLDTTSGGAAEARFASSPIATDRAAMDRRGFPRARTS